MRVVRINALLKENQSSDYSVVVVFTRRLAVLLTKRHFYILSRQNTLHAFKKKKENLALQVSPTLDYTKHIVFGRTRECNGAQAINSLWVHVLRTKE